MHVNGRSCAIIEKRLTSAGVETPLTHVPQPLDHQPRLPIHLHPPVRRTARAVRHPVRLAPHRVEERVDEEGRILLRERLQGNQSIERLGCGIQRRREGRERNEEWRLTAGALLPSLSSPYSISLLPRPEREARVAVDAADLLRGLDEDVGDEGRGDGVERVGELCGRVSVCLLAGGLGCGGAMGRRRRCRGVRWKRRLTQLTPEHQAHLVREVVREIGEVRPARPHAEHVLGPR